MICQMMKNKELWEMLEFSITELKAFALSSVNFINKFIFRIINDLNLCFLSIRFEVIDV